MTSLTLPPRIRLSVVPQGRIPTMLIVERATHAVLDPKGEANIPFEVVRFASARSLAEMAAGVV